VPIMRANPAQEPRLGSPYPVFNLEDGERVTVFPGPGGRGSIDGHRQRIEELAELTPREAPRCGVDYEPGVTTMLRKRTLPWSPCSMRGPGSPSNGLMAPPVMPSRMPSTIFFPLRVTLIWRPTTSMS